MVDIHHASTAKAPVDVVFAYMDDHRNVPEWMFGVSKFEPIGEKDSGVGAVFDGSIKLGPKTLHSTVECTEWEQDRVIGMKSIKGFVNWSTWRFNRIDDVTTELAVDFTYVLPGGMAGRALGKIIEPFITIAIRHTEQRLREKVEQRYAEQAR